MTETDDKVIEEILAGNRDAFAILVDKYKDKVFSLVFGIVKDYELAQEVAQDVFIKAYSSLKKFRRDSSFSTWIYRISYNTAISETRKRKVKKVSFDENISSKISNEEIEDNAESWRKDGEQKKLSRALSQLLPDERVIISLYYFEEKAISEICEITGLGQSNVKVKLHRLRKKLKALITEISKAELAFL